MTLNGAIMELVVLEESSMMPAFFRPAIQKVIETICDTYCAYWIPCTNRLPEDDRKVLCCTVTKKGQKNIVIGYYAEGRWCCGMNSNVIAWMELPEVYEDD